MKVRKKYDSPESSVWEMETEDMIAVSDVLGLPGLPFDEGNINDYDDSF